MVEGRFVVPAGVAGAASGAWAERVEQRAANATEQRSIFMVCLGLVTLVYGQVRALTCRW